MMKDKIVCIVCPNSCILSLNIDKDGNKSVSGNRCERGKVFYFNELNNPVRTITTTVKTIFDDYPVISVRTDKDVPKDMIFEVMNEINRFVLKKRVKCGEVLIENILNTGSNIIATKSITDGGIYTYE